MKNDELLDPFSGNTVDGNIEWFFNFSFSTHCLSDFCYFYYSYSYLFSLVAGVSCYRMNIAPFEHNFLPNSLQFPSRPNKAVQWRKCCIDSCVQTHGVIQRLEVVPGDIHYGYDTCTRG